MASAFTLTLAYLGEECSAADAGGAFAAYITGNVASNLIGRLISAAVADHLGLACELLFLRGAQSRRRGAGLLHRRAAPADGRRHGAARRSPFAAWLAHLRNPRLRAAFGIGFCILFAFIGTFTYVNFVLVRPPLSLGPMQLGFVYFVFLPSIVTTLLAGRVVHRFGTRPTCGRRWHSPASACRCCCCPIRGGAAGHGADRRRHVLCPGDCDRLRRAARQPPTAARRAASISLATSPAVWSAGDPRSDLRPDRLAGLRRWNCAVARRGSSSRFLPENDPRPLQESNP